MRKKRPGAPRRGVGEARQKEAYCDCIAQLAVKALLYEVCIGPKPGLVDRFNNGSHQDMNLFTFLDSACALSGYFREITGLAMGLRRVPPQSLLPRLRLPGIEAERRMFCATGGINTHKGIIYSLGIFCATCGYVYESRKRVSSDELFRLCGVISGDPRPQGQVAGTNGERLYQKYRIEGIRGEVFRGFPSVRLYGLPAYCRAKKWDWPESAAGVYALFHIMTHLEDTNLISRSNLETQQRVRENIRQLLDTPSLTPEQLLEQAERMDEEFIGLNISPGGAADMLSITLMMWFLEKEFPARFGSDSRI